jgi:hypothetical protein
MTTVDEFLEHHGIKGMRWGVRKSRSAPSGPTDVIVRERPGKKVKTSGGQYHPPSEDAKRVAVAKRKARKSSTDSLSTKDLQELVNRMNLEQQYSKLRANEPTPLKRGNQAIKSILGIGTTVNQAVALANSPSGKLLKSSLMKAPK